MGDGGPVREGACLSELVKKAPGTLAPRDTRREIEGMIDRQVKKDLGLISLANHIFREENDPHFTKLTTRQQKIVRAWELPRKEAPFALEATANRLTALIKGKESRSDAMKINVENLTVHLPAKQSDDLPPPVIIDVKAE